MKKYGTMYSSQNETIKNKIKNTKRMQASNQILNKLKLYNLEIMEPYVNSTVKHKFKCLICNNTFIQIWNEIQKGYKCPTCYPRNIGISQQEMEVASFIESLGYTIQTNNKSIIKPYELDIFIPSHNVAFEYNGTYWHSWPNQKNKNYHLDKTKKCEEINIRLFHIFEDEWLNNPELIKRKIYNILNEQSITIRNVDFYIQEITKNEVINNINYHPLFSSLMLALYVDGCPISILFFEKNKIEIQPYIEWKIIDFYCSFDYSDYYIDLFDNLINYFKINYDWDEILVDIERGWPNLKCLNNFKLNYKSKPNFYFIDGNKRIPSHKYPNYSILEKETDYCIKNNLSIIYDCGNLCYRLKRRIYE